MMQKVGPRTGSKGTVRGRQGLEGFPSPFLQTKEPNIIKGIACALTIRIGNKVEVTNQTNLVLLV